MKKKKAFTILCVSIICLLLLAFTNQIEKIYTKRQNFPQKKLTIERTYRGKHCVLMKMTDKQRTVIAFIINGKTIATESDEDGDGFFEEIMIFDPENGDFEKYMRSTNWALTPIDSFDLNELKAKKSKADNELEEQMNLYASTNALSVPRK